MRKRWLRALVWLPLLVLGTLCYAAGPDASTLVRDYKKLKNLTPQGFQVNPELAALCRGVDDQDITRAAKTHGPHAYCEIRVFANPLAEKALKTRVKSFPVGSVLVKEKRAGQVLFGQSDAPLRRNGVTGMIKRAPGYDPEHGDWEYFIREEGGKVESGRIATCVSCHARATGPDHLFATWFKANARQRPPSPPRR